MARCFVSKDAEARCRGELAVEIALVHEHDVVFGVPRPRSLSKLQIDPLLRMKCRADRRELREDRVAARRHDFFSWCGAPMTARMPEASRRRSAMGRSSATSFPRYCLSTTSRAMALSSS